MKIVLILEHAHRFCTRNRQLIADSTQCGCFYCMQTFQGREVMDWVDWPEGSEKELEDGVTALCPQCGIDSVLPEPPIAITREFLVAMNQHYF